MRSRIWMATLKMKIVIKFNIKTLKTFKIWNLIFRVPRNGMSGLPYLQMGWGKVFQNICFHDYHNPKVLTLQSVLIVTALRLEATSGTMWQCQHPSEPEPLQSSKPINRRKTIPTNPTINRNHPQLIGSPACRKYNTGIGSVGGHAYCLIVVLWAPGQHNWANCINSLNLSGYIYRLVNSRQAVRVDWMTVLTQPLSLYHPPTNFKSKETVTFPALF